MSQELIIVSLKPSHAEAFLEFSDSLIGEGYYQRRDFDELIRRCQSSPTNPSFALMTKNNPMADLKGVRVTYPHGQWLDLFSEKQLYAALWPFASKDAAYFKSLFVSPEFRGEGWGPRLSARSLSQLEQAGAKGIVTHCWKESPGNSSQRYLEKMGFQVVGEHPCFWDHVDYLCTGCKLKPCKCTALEMVKSLY